MSELGQNEGQEQNEKATFFDSAKISEKKDVEHFSNVEGAEERAKAAERARKAAEKEAAEVHAADVRAAAEQMKKAENKQAGKKGGILGFLFGGWHKWVTVVAILAIVAGAVLLIFKSIPESEERILERDNLAIERAQMIYVEAEKVRLGGSYEDAKAKFEEALKDCNREENIFITIKYAEYIASMEYDRKTADSMLDSVEGLVQTEIEKEYILVGRGNVKQYSGVNDEE